MEWKEMLYSAGIVRWLIAGGVAMFAPLAIHELGHIIAAWAFGVQIGFAGFDSSGFHLQFISYPNGYDFANTAIILDAGTAAVVLSALVIILITSYVLLTHSTAWYSPFFIFLSIALGLTAAYSVATGYWV